MQGLKKKTRLNFIQKYFIREVNVNEFVCKYFEAKNSKKYEKN